MLSSIRKLPSAQYSIRKPSSQDIEMDSFQKSSKVNGRNTEKTTLGAMGNIATPSTPPILTNIDNLKKSVAALLAGERLPGGRYPMNFTPIRNNDSQEVCRNCSEVFNKLLNQKSAIPNAVFYFAITQLQLILDNLINAINPRFNPALELYRQATKLVEQKDNENKPVLAPYNSTTQN